MTVHVLAHFRRSFSTSVCLCGTRTRLHYDKRYPVSEKHLNKRKLGGDEELGKKVRRTLVQPTGYIDVRRKKFVTCKEMIPEFIVPDLTGFELKPYVSYTCKQIYQKKFTAQDLFNATCASDVQAKFESGQYRTENDVIIKDTESNIEPTVEAQSDPVSVVTKPDSSKTIAKSQSKPAARVTDQETKSSKNSVFTRIKSAFKK